MYKLCTILYIVYEQLSTNSRCIVLLLKSLLYNSIVVCTPLLQQLEIFCNIHVPTKIQQTMVTMK